MPRRLSRQRSPAVEAFGVERYLLSDAVMALSLSDLKSDGTGWIARVRAGRCHAAGDCRDGVWPCGLRLRPSGDAVRKTGSWVRLCHLFGALGAVSMAAVWRTNVAGMRLVPGNRVSNAADVGIYWRTGILHFFQRFAGPLTPRASPAAVTIETIRLCSEN